MKKKQFVFINCLTLLLLAVSFLAITFSEEANDFSPDNQCINGTFEGLIEDDNSFEITLPVLSGAYIVSCLEPSDYPSFLTEVEARVSNFFGEDTRMAVFTDIDGDGPDGDPIWESASFEPLHREWFSIDVSNVAAFNTPINSGLWCIGFKQIAFWFFELHDTSSSNQHTWTGTSDTGWTRIDTVSPGNGAFRGVVEYCPDYCGCFIDGQCYAEGDTNPTNDCQICDPDTSINSWSLHNGSACDDGIFCNGEDTCQGGLCSQHTGNPCPQDDGLYCNGTETFECIEATDECGHTGNPCPIDDNLFCNGDETADCVEATDECGHTGDPCEENEECNEDEDECVLITDDDTSDDDATDDDATDDDATDDDATDDDATDDDATDDDATDDDATDDDATDDDATDDDATDDDATDDDATDDDATDDDATDDDSTDDDTTDDDTSDDDAIDDDTFGDDDNDDGDDDLDPPTDDDMSMDDRGDDDDDSGGCAC